MLSRSETSADGRNADTNLMQDKNSRQGDVETVKRSETKAIDNASDGVSKVGEHAKINGRMTESP
ncbi:MAG: hypothetical protein EA381_00260 [Planctomycetaceae bacterium]|nr:MAG: hypothetical protein EA381_00260 [Planctomycetaceae bacterium]